MTPDAIFSGLIYLAWPAAFLYPLVYVIRAKWWKTWIGQALLIKAVGVWILLTVSLLYQFFGPDYWGRDALRITGASLVTVGIWYALVAMLREFGFFAWVGRKLTHHR